MCTCDEIGNRKTLKEGGTNVLGAGLRTTNYFKDVPGTGGALGANALNQYGSIERPQTFDVTGKRAHGSATIKVNGPTALTSGDYQPAGTGLYFRKEVANTPTPWQMNDNYEPVQVTQNDTELTPDQGALQHVGPPTFSPSYDADGNLLADGRWSYTWDGENRLIKMEALEWIQPTSSGSYLAGSSWQATRLEFRYDGFSRRISKKTTRLTGNTVASTAMEGYLYDRWNVIMISQLDPVIGAHLARKWSCLWKPDVASLPYARTSWQAAGGVGGLAWLQTGGTQNMSTTYHSYYGQYVLTGNAEIQVPIMDHMGNVRHFIQLKSGTVNQGYGNIGTMIGQVSANLEYDAFGREVRVSSLAVPDTGTPPEYHLPPKLRRKRMNRRKRQSVSSRRPEAGGAGDGAVSGDRAAAGAGRREAAAAAAAAGTGAVGHCTALAGLRGSLSVVKVSHQASGAAKSTGIDPGHPQGSLLLGYPSNVAPLEG